MALELDTVSVARIRQAYETIWTEIEAHRTVPEVTLVAASKYVDAQGILNAMAAGGTDFGENKVLDALGKQEQIQALKVPDMAGMAEPTWHFIGHLQSNKLNKCLGRFSLIHSVDRMDLLEKLSQRCEAKTMIQPVLLQVNVAEEESKSGFLVSKMSKAMATAVELPGVSVKGLMTMAPLGATSSELDRCFGGLAKLRDRLQAEYAVDLPHLSMGMSQDYGHALQSGATILRIGSQIFNPVVR